jgi:aryl-alcohol dehydrogenase-like predicted oxidoreductase
LVRFEVTFVEYRALGKTGLKVSALSFGASSLGGGVFGPVEESQAIRTVHTALDLGINLIDVAPFYGLTRAETVLGKALKERPRDRYFLGTKVGRYGDTDFDFSAKRVTRSVEESLTRLNTDYVDFIQAHDNEYGDLNQIIEETLPALRLIQKEGKARYIGVTGYPLKIFRKILSHIDVDVILSYNHYALNDTTLLQLLPFLEGKNVGIMSACPVSQGLLTNQGTPDWHPAPDTVKSVCAEVAAYCRSQGSDISRLAMQFALSNPRIHTVAVGTASPEIIENNVRWIDELTDQKLLANVQSMLSGIKDQTWIVGKPENN